MAVLDSPAVDLETERSHRKRQVALGYRLFAALRWGDLGDGHITARDPELTDHMWLLRGGLGFEHATVDDLVLVAPDGTAVDGRRFNSTAYNIHHPIHAARPDVVSAAHTHTQWGTPFCSTGRSIESITQEACLFLDDWAYFDDDEVQVRNRAGGERIAAALGDRRAILLKCHGLLTAYETVGAAVAAFVTLERVCEAMMKAPDATPISEDAARLAYDDMMAFFPFDEGFDYLVSRHIGDPSIVG